VANLKKGGGKVLRKKFFSLSFSLVLFLLLICHLFIFAEESLTITTYYPSPYGSYNEVRANKMVIGDVDTNTTPSPSQGAVTFAPISEPAAYSEGTLYYDSSEHNFKYRNDSSWQTVGGGITITYYCFVSSGTGSPVCTDAGGSQGYCPSGYTQRLALGSWGHCYLSTTSVGNDYFLPPGASCGTDCVSTRIVGSAYICSQDS